MARNIPPLLPSETKQKDGGHLNSALFSGFSKVKNLYITGHSDGATNFWDISCPFLLPILSLKQQVSSKLVLMCSIGTTVPLLTLILLVQIAFTSGIMGMLLVPKKEMS